MHRAEKLGSVSSGCNVNTTTNRFDFLRLLFAGVVALYHAVFLTKLAPLSPIEMTLAQLAEISIQGFFIISGALVLGSLIRSTSISAYTEKRIRRLYPAYVLVILIPAIISLILFQDVKGVLSYVVPNLGFLNFLGPTLPGLFEGSYAGIVNGALWTLKIEVMFYIAIPIIWLVMKRLPKLQIPMIILMVISAEIWRQFFQYSDHHYASQLARQLPAQIGYFACGMLLWLNWDKIKSSKTWWALLGLALVMLSVLHPYAYIVRAPGLALIIAWVAFASGPALNAAKYGDMSYGVYITHFPIIQMCIVFGLFKTPIIGLTVSLSLTVIASYALWHFVEKRALLPSSHYRNAA